GPDFQMITEAFGGDPYDKQAGKLQASKAALHAFYTWVKYCVDKKALFPNNSAMSWDAIEQAAMGGEEALVFFHGVWRVTDQMKAFKFKGKDDYFHKYTWINAPAGRRAGSRPTFPIRSRMPCRRNRRTRSSPPTSLRWRASPI